MALDPRDARHAGQIAAGTTGRNRGHAFEHALSVQVRELRFPLPSRATDRIKHLVEGDPATELVRYVVSEQNLAKPTVKTVYWLGGLATSGEGDLVPGPDGSPITGSKSDIVIALNHNSGRRVVGVSVKTCFNRAPTNAQLYCSTALAFCNLLRSHGLAVSSRAEKGLRMFCGDPGFRPLDEPRAIEGRLATPQRWFWEEISSTARDEWERLLSDKHSEILTILLRKAYPNDPYPPDYVLHVRHKAPTPDKVPLAIYSVKELVSLSCRYQSFKTREYRVRKGTYKDDPDTHLAPRFGIVQFQPIGNKQNRSQLQFNLQANYFNKLPYSP